MIILNFPIRLNNKLAHLNSLTRVGNYAPTQQAIDFKNEITKEIDIELEILEMTKESKTMSISAVGIQ